MAEVLVASGNAKKLAELRRILERAGVGGLAVLGLGDVAAYELPAETGTSFEENALIKARAGAFATGLATLADDSGFAVDSLCGMPGVLSARWAGARAGDEANRELLLEQMQDFAPDKRRARFVSVCALVVPDGPEILTRGEWAGAVAEAASGSGGFGYDPVFLPDDARGRTAAQLEPLEKDALSHRGRALAEMLPHLAALR
ncbi:non-canonical purine NTP pyrophosphatase [Segniliparus rugosus]|uniref:dITP/XTP pyrophosphatase n=1 Tax=Segniliparus rugosus (strain ATCC BAA-974 / DSM 45345 / CCUG 50838 / CIP 108380 / JCM 13579 / CDC 945) TaxID=679197 RepID=E5XTH1_SEGRC|nr:non-canonical purine NTP pyrophosphatase [Segniliparus rugosus]EFV12354.1 rdgB/HAM1 family non-canonical purine NTP pyrophosphatase [Segniliparus rugosus ATCC BAA-974]